MEEAEGLCDRLGIFVDGALRCIGNPKAILMDVLFTYCTRIPMYLM
jgi:ABC-type multidrug transport system ATPase subunit